jgi:tetratricopeptide (TPR) repeat protein
MEIIASAAVDLAASPALPADQRGRAEYVLTFMYERFLRNYSALQTRLDEVFVSGRYNCVSSAVFYTILASSIGLEVQGVMTRDHAFVTVNAGGELIDVETTNPYGFNPGSRRDFQDAFGSVTGFAYVPARNYRDRVNISPLELVSLILSNRIAELETRGRYGEAVPLAVSRADILSRRSDPTNSPFFVDPEKDLRDRIFNYGAALIKDGKDVEALAWADIARRRFDDSRWDEFISAALNNQLVRLLRSQRIADARSALESRAPSLGAASYNRLNALVLDAELFQRIAQLGKTETAETLLRAIDNAQGALAASRIEELRNFIILKEGELLAAEQGAAAAIAYVEAAIARYGRNTRLDEALRVHRQNRVAALHNGFAALFNRRDYAAARLHIIAALEEFPENRQLQSDLRTVEQALRR